MNGTELGRQVARAASAAKFQDDVVRASTAHIMRMTLADLFAMVAPNGTLPESERGAAFAKGGLVRGSMTAPGKRSGFGTDFIAVERKA